MHKRSGRVQIKASEELTWKAGVIISESGCGLPELIAYQNYLSRRQIAMKVYNCKDFGNGKAKPFDDGTSVVIIAGGLVEQSIYLLY